MKIIILLIYLAATVAAASSQEAPKVSVAVSQDNPYSANTRFAYMGLKAVLLHSAEKMPEENYNYKPAESARSYGRIIGHIADSQYIFCSVALGEKNPLPKIEQNKTSKTELITALKGSFAYCDKAYNDITDKSGAIMVKLMGFDTPKLGALIGNNSHSAQHYGNLVTYMRLKNIVPPTSEPGFMQQMMQMMKK